MDNRWRKIPREVPDGEPWNTGICSAQVQEWLKRRATDTQRDKLEYVFNEKLRIPFSIPEKAYIPVKERKKVRPEMTPVGKRVDSRTSTPGTYTSGSSSLEIKGSQQGPGMGHPPGMSSEGWNQTDGLDSTGVIVKPHRAKKKRHKNKAVQSNNRPHFNPPRQLTSYESAYAGSELMTDMYENVRRVTAVQPVQNQSFVSEWGDDMKKTDMTVWKRNLTSTYTQANQEVHQSDTNKALRENKANVFYNWARRKNLYYGDLMNPEAVDQVSQWLREASNEERDECLEVLRTLHSVVDPLGAGSCGLGEGTWEHEVYRHNRPTSADKNRGMEYWGNKDRDGHTLKALDALEARQRVMQERDRLKKENREKKAIEVKIAEKKAEDMMNAKRELLKEFTPEFFKASEQADMKAVPVHSWEESRESLASPQASSESLRDSPMLAQQPSSQYRLKSSNEGQMKGNWGFQGMDPNYNKTSYQMAHGANIPELMMNIKKANAEKVASASNALHTTPSFGAVNYVGYEHTAVPQEYSVPRHFTDGLKEGTFAQAFIPTPNMKAALYPPPVRTLRPTSSSVSGSAARRDPTLYAATLAARRSTMSARHANVDHLRSKVAIGNSGMSTTWGTTYTDTHSGRQKDRPITAPAHAIPYKTSI